MEVTRTLARYVVNSRASDIPDAVKREGVRSILNWLGCAVGAARHDAVECALAALLPFAGPRKPPCSAARQDRHPDGGAAERHHKPRLRFRRYASADHHSPSGPVASALFALAEYRPVSGAELLHAFILGVEVECRIGNAVYPTITMSAGTSPEPRACSARLLRRASFSPFRAADGLGTRHRGHPSSAFARCSARIARASIRGARHRTPWFGASGGEELHQLHSGDRSQARLCECHVDQARLFEDHEGLGKSFEVTLNSTSVRAVVHRFIFGADACVQLKLRHGSRSKDGKCNMTVDAV